MDQDYLESIMNYNPQTGVCFWNKRPRTDFSTAAKTKAWNTKHAGQEMGDIDPSSGRLRVSLNNKTFPLDKLIWCYLYNEFPKSVYHINGWQADNRQSNLVLNRMGCLEPSRYKGGPISLIYGETDEVYWIVSEGHVFSAHEDLTTARKRLKHLGDILNCEWEDETADI